MPSIPGRGGGHPAFTTQLTLCCAMTFAGYLAVSMRLPIVPLHATALGASAAQIGLINAAFYLMAGCLSLPAGMLSDRFGRRRLALAGTLLMAVGLGLLAPSRSYIHLAGVYLVLGAGIAAFGPTMMSWVAEIAPATHLGRAYGWYTTALFCGMGLGPAAGGTLAKDLGFTSVYLIGGALMAVNLLLVGRLVPGAPARDRPGTHRRDSRQWRSVLTNRALIGCWVATLGTCIVSGAFFTFLPLHAAARGLDVQRIGVVFLVQSAANALARIPLGAASDRLGRRPLQALVGILLISASVSLFMPARQYVHFLAAALGLGVSNALAFTSIGALIAETVSAPLRGLAMGGYNTCIYLGLMVGAFGFGPAAEATGLGGVFLLAGLANLPLAIFFGWILNPLQTRQKRI